MRYIDADKLIEEIESCSYETWSKGLNSSWWAQSVKLKDNMVNLIKKASSADVEEVRHGEWNKKFIYSYNWDDFYSLTCSECGAHIGETSVKAEDFKYCFNCGAKMDGERREE